MTCPECGTSMEAKARFCHHCGWDSTLAAAGKASSSAGSRPAWKRWTMSVCLGIASVFILFMLLAPRSDASAQLVTGQAAPDFTVQTLDGEAVKLSDLKGQPVVLNFWASWCGPCRKEMPDLEAVYQKYKENGLQVIGVNVGDSKVAVSNFQSQVQTTFPLWLDLKEEAQQSYKILPIPATFFVDRNGTIRAIYQFQMSGAQIESEVLRLMNP
jgi:cytochrome c biogenesis protein CcmG, thiol:disulfide interchange protein DsbE